MRIRVAPLCILAAVAIIAIGGHAAYANRASDEPATSEYAEYRNDRWHFSLAVPADLTATVHDHPGGQTILFIDPIGEFKFRVFTWPYSQLDLTLGRIGEPSNTADQPDHLEIVDVIRDDMFTVLFQKNGIRYVVSALPDHEAWLTDILTTWQFD